MQAVQSKRRSRIYRQSTGKRLRLSGRDIEVFKLLDGYRYLRSSFICAFFPNADRTGLLKRLGDLFHEGYLDRPTRQYQYANALYLPAVYSLNARSDALLRDHGCDCSPLQIPGGRPGACRHFSHALMISDAMASIELGVRQSALRFISWMEIIGKAPCKDRNNPFRIPVSIRDRDHQADITLIPDGLFGLEYRDGGAKSYRFFALEADRDSMPIRRSRLIHTSYFRKLLGYRHILAQGIHRSHFGIPNLFILTVTVSEMHRTNMMHALSELTSGQGSTVFLFKTMSALGDFMRAPEPSPHMLFEPWAREGHPPFDISEA
jgi:hypothetical protein